MNYKAIFSTGKNALVTDLGLLLLRISFGLSLLLKHGLEKITGFSQMVPVFPDPLHLGTHLSFTIAATSDVLAAVLLMAGFATRPAALFIAGNVGVAWIFVHNAQFFGSKADHGELCVLYLCGCVSLAFSGAGRFSADAFLRRSG
jgi:putative oxidoreductase